MTGLPNIRDLVLHDSDIDLDDVGGTVDPSTLSRLDVTNAIGPPSGIASGVEQYVEFGEPQEVVGTDIAVNGEDATVVDILADGVYSVFANPGVTGAITSVEVQLYASDPTALPNRHIDQITQSVGSAYEYPSVSETIFLSAGSQLQLSVLVTTSASTWDLLGARLRVQRVA